MHDQRLIGYLVAGLAIALGLIFRFRRLSRTRPLRLERLWILPALITAGAAAALAQLPPHPQDWPWLGAALVLGAGLGWLRGSLMAISVDADTHALNTRASPAAIVFLLALFGARFALRAAASNHLGGWSVGPALLTDASLLFAVGLISVQRIEIAVRARRMLAAVREAASEP